MHTRRGGRGRASARARAVSATLLTCASFPSRAGHTHHTGEREARANVSVQKTRDAPPPRTLALTPCFPALLPPYLDRFCCPPSPGALPDAEPSTRPPSPSDRGPAIGPGLARRWRAHNCRPRPARGGGQWEGRLPLTLSRRPAFVLGPASVPAPPCPLRVASADLPAFGLVWTRARLRAAHGLARPPDSCSEAWPAQSVRWRGVTGGGPRPREDGRARETPPNKTKRVAGA